MKIGKELKYFISHQDELVKQYNGKYIAIKNNKIIGSYDDSNQAFFRTAEKETPGTFIIQHCIAGEKAYTRYVRNRM